MKNVTITLEENVARWARIEAAKVGKSLSRWIGEKIAFDMNDESVGHEALERFLSGPGYPGIAEDLPSKDQIHDRP
jgi:hypothetical protein